MNNHSVLHLTTDAVYSSYTYNQIYVNVGATLVYNGVTLPGPTGGPIILNLTVSNPTQISGSSGIALLGIRNPESFHVGPAGQNGLNSDGTWSIK